MNWEQWIKCVKLMKSIWMKTDFLGDEYSVNVWYRMLKDIPFELFCMAVEKCAVTSTFPPSIAELRDQVVSIQADSTDWSDGWREVLNAIQKFGYVDEAGALESMSQMTRDVVKRLGWMYICSASANEFTSIRANFRMIYQQKEQNIRDQMKLPQDLNDKIKAITKGDELLLEQD